MKNKAFYVFSIIAILLSCSLCNKDVCSAEPASTNYVDNVVLAKVGNVEITVSDYRKYLNDDSSDKDRQDAFKALVDTALLSQEAIKLNLDKDENVLKQTAEKQDIWDKRQILASAFTDQIESECKDLSGLANRLVKNKAHRYKIINMITNGLTRDQIIFCKNTIWDEYLEYLRKEYSVSEHYGLAYELVSDVTHPIIILPVTFKNDFIIIQSTAICYNLPFSNNESKKIGIILEVKNELPWNLDLKGLMNYSNNGQRIVEHEAFISSDGIELGHTGDSIPTGKKYKYRIIYFQIDNHDEMKDLKIDLRDIGINNNYDFIWNLLKGKNGWMEYNTRKKVINDKPKDLIKFGLEFYFRHDSESNENKFVKENYGWKCNIMTQNKSSENVFLEWPPLISDNNGSTYNFQTNQNISGYYQPHEYIPDAELLFKDDIPFTVKELNITFTLREDEVKNSESKKIIIKMIRTSDTSFDYKSN